MNNDILQPGSSKQSNAPVEPAAQQPGRGMPPIQPQQSLDPQPMRLPKKQRKWWLLGGIVALLILIVVGVVMVYAWYSDSLGARSSQSDKIRISIAPGASSEQITDELEKKGVIKNGLALLMHIKLHGANKIQAGNYLFMPSQTALEVLDWLNAGRVDTYKVTIFPGRRLAEIKDELIKAGYAPEAIDAAFAKQYDHPLFSTKPANTNLEGYIFPETYFLASNASAEDLLVRSFDEFEKRLEQKNIRAQLETRGLTLSQAINLASLVSGEVPGFSDRRQVAQVFEKRLKTDMPLGSDVSYKYAAKLLGVPPSPDLDSPFNTRKVKGLPPTPVSNFNFDAIEAVANPAAGEYVFFVSGDDGVTHFSYTAEEHQRNIEKYCQKQCASN